MTERDPNYRAFTKFDRMGSEIIEVGLGRGDLALNMVETDRTTGYRSYERDPAVVARFNAANPVRPPKLDIREEDFETSPLGVKRFDCGIIDTIETNQQSFYDEAWRYARELERRIQPGGIIIVEFLADVPMEAQLKFRLRRRFGRQKLAFVKMSGMTDTRNIAYYEL